MRGDLPPHAGDESEPHASLAHEIAEAPQELSSDPGLRPGAADGESQERRNRGVRSRERPEEVPHLVAVRLAERALWIEANEARREVFAKHRKLAAAEQLGRQGKACEND